MSEVIQKAKAAKKVSFELVSKSTDEKNQALAQIAEQLIIDKDKILVENAKDLQKGKERGLSESVLDRIMLNEQRIIDMSDAIKQLIQLEDPVGEILETIKKENGLNIVSKRVPLGVIGMIYEARPNVTIDAATLALKTGNAMILRGSSSAAYSNQVLTKTIHRALEKTSIPVEAVQSIEDTDREAVKELYHLKEYLDVLIPRGGKKLIDTVVKESTVPVIETGAGNCHIFIDESAKKDMAISIAINGKTQRPSVCNAIETILVQEKWLDQYGTELFKALNEKDVKIIGDEKVCQLYKDATLATEEDWYTEFLGLTIAVKVVSNVTEAIEHINQYGTKHSEAIMTEDEGNASVFLTSVDAASVYHNASTRFTDGFEFGFGAEIGISTQKLHARGPMGLKALTSSKFFIYGEGQVRN